jgi:methyl-accepting chemotaxis protein
MKATSTYSLQRTMIVYFLLIGFASLLVGVEFLFETQGHQIKQEIFSNFEKHSKNEITADRLFTPIDRLRSKAILMIVIVLLVVVIVLKMFIKNITEPLQHMIRLSRAISKGDLTQTVRIEAKNELAELGNVINEMSSNLQEITQLSRNLCTSGNLAISKLSFILEKSDHGAAQIEELRQQVGYLKADLDLLGGFSEYFNFYSVEKGTHA